MKDTHDALMIRTRRRYGTHAAYQTHPRRNDRLSYERSLTPAEASAREVFCRAVTSRLREAQRAASSDMYYCLELGWRDYTPETWVTTALPAFLQWLRDNHRQHFDYHRKYAEWRAGVPTYLLGHETLTRTPTGHITRKNLGLILAACTAEATTGDYFPNGRSLKFKAQLEALPLALKIVVCHGSDTNPRRMREVDWDKVRKVRAQIKAKPGVALAWISSYSTSDPIAAGLMGGVKPSHISWTRYYLQSQYPDYKNCNNQVLRLLLRGVSPAEIFGGKLTSKEAHDCLKNHPEHDWASYLLRDVPLEYRNIRLSDFDAEMLRFLGVISASGQWDKVTRRREGADYAGKVRPYTYAQYMNRLKVEDLPRGSRTPINTAFERCIARCHVADREIASKHCAPLRDLCAEMVAALYPRCMRYLNSLGDLMLEGQQLRHCVGSESYADGVRNGSYAIFSLDVAGHRSTLRIDGSGLILEHYGAGDSNPHPLCEKVAARFSERLRAPYEARRKAEREAEAERRAAAAANAPRATYWAPTHGTYTVNGTLTFYTWRRGDEWHREPARLQQPPAPPAPPVWVIDEVDIVPHPRAAARPRPRPRRNAYAELDAQTDAVSYEVADGRAYTRQATPTDAARLEWQPALVLQAALERTQRALALQVAPMLV